MADSTFWADSSGCVWRRVPVIHRATGNFALLYDRVSHGRAGTLLRAFAPDFMPLPEVFPVVNGDAASVEGALAEFITHKQGLDVAVFPDGLTYATTHC